MGRSDCQISALVQGIPPPALHPAEDRSRDQATPAATDD